MRWGNNGSGNGGGGGRSGNGDGGNNGNGGNGGHGNGGGNGNPPDGGHGGRGSGRFPDGTYKRKPNDPYTPRKYDPARPDVSKKPDAPTPHKPDVSKTPDGNNNNRIDSDKKINTDKTPDLKKSDAPKRNSPKGLIGKEFESWLVEYLGGTGGFQANIPNSGSGSRDFDVAVGDRWIEAKSGEYWKNSSANFRDKAGEQQKLLIIMANPLKFIAMSQFLRI